MKKICAVLLSLILVFSLCSCGASNSGGPSSPTDKPKDSSELGPGCYDDEEQILITFVACEVGIPYFTTMNWGALDAAKDYNVDLYFTGPAIWDFSAQMPFLEAAMAMNPKALILVPSDEVSLVTYVEEYMDSGIPVICCDVALDEPVSLVDYESNQYSGGKIAAEYMVKINGEGGVYLPVSAAAGDYASEERSRGFIETMKEINPTATILETIYSGDETTYAAQMVSAAITANPDITGIYATQSAVAAGASSAVIEAGKLGKITIAAYDADPQQVEDLKEGVYDVLIAQDPYHMGYDAVANLAKLIRGDLSADDFTEDVVNYEMFVISKDNMETEEAKRYMYIEDLSLVGY